MNNLVGNFIGFEGRLNRQPFWISAVVLMVISVIISVLVLPLVGLSLAPPLPILGADGTAPDMVAAQGKASWASFVLLLVFAYPSAAISIKRRHDRNASGIDVWIYFALAAISLLVNALGIGMTTVDVGNGLVLPIPGPIATGLMAIVGIYAIYLLIVLGFLKGTTGPNQYGPDPLQG